MIHVKVQAAARRSQSCLNPDMLRFCWSAPARRNLSQGWCRQRPARTFGIVLGRASEMNRFAVPCVHRLSGAVADNGDGARIGSLDVPFPRCSRQAPRLPSLCPALVSPDCWWPRIRSAKGVMACATSSRCAGCLRVGLAASGDVDTRWCKFEPAKVYDAGVLGCRWIVATSTGLSW